MQTPPNVVFASYHKSCVDAIYGVPQKRLRFFILATKYMNLSISAPIPSHINEITVGEAFAGLPNVLPNTNVEGREYTAKTSNFARLMRDNVFWKVGSGITNNVTYQMPMKHRKCTLERFSLLSPGESLKDLFIKYTGIERKELQKRRVLPNKMFIKRNYRLRINEASPTVTSHCLDEFVHPLKNRALTVRECARLQSFPDYYDFVGGPYLAPHIDKTVQDKYEQIGDAVPPLLAYAWGNEISKILTGDK